MSFLPMGNSAKTMADLIWKRTHPNLPIYPGTPPFIPETGGGSSLPQAGVPPQVLGGVQPQEPGDLVPGMIGVRTGDFAAPQVGPQAAPSATPAKPEGFWSRFTGAMRNPGTQAAMLAAGNAMTAPRGFGQTGWNQFTQALMQGVGTKNAYDAYQAQMALAMQQRDFENRIKQGELGVKQQEAENQRVLNQAHAGLYGAQATDLPAARAQEGDKITDQQKRTQGQIDHWKAMEDNANRQIEVEKQRETRLVKALEFEMKNAADKNALTKRGQDIQNALGGVRNNLYKQHLDQVYAKLQAGTEEGLRPLMISVFQSISKMAEDPSSDLADLPVEQKAAKIEELAKATFNRMKEQLPRRTPVVPGGQTSQPTVQGKDPLGLFSGGK